VSNKPFVKSSALVDDDEPPRRFKGFGESSSPATRESPSVPDSPSTQASPSTVESPATTPPVALPHESPSAVERPSRRANFKPRSRAEYRTGDSRTIHDFFDNELCPLPPLSQLLWFHLNRYRESGSY
jgi:hypothetical protein